jgi:hypothetical protein
MPLAFCDLNFIVTAHQGADVYKDHLRQLVGTGTVTFVLSPMHWVEAAKADFMDGLQARWIYERRFVQRKETAAAFFRFRGIQGNPPQMIGSVAEVIADLTGVQAQRNSRDFVALLRIIGQNHPLEESLRQALDSNRVNGDRFRTGQLDAHLSGAQKN